MGAIMGQSESARSRGPPILMRESRPIMPAETGHMRAELGTVIDAVVKELGASDAFESVGIADEGKPDHVLLIAVAKDTPEPVFYRLEVVDGLLAVSWCSPDRYISQSIETDVLWTGDDLDDLIDEELVDLGWNRGRLKPLKHFRNDEMLFVFISQTPIKAGEATEADAADLAKAVLAYEIAFRELGDMAGDEDDD